MMAQKYAECCNYTRLFRQWGRLRRQLFCIAIPVVMMTLSLRSLASITTGYSDGRPTGPFLTLRGLFRWPPYGSLPHSSRAIQMAALWASSSLFTGYSDGSPLGVFLTLRGLFRWPPFRHLLRFSLLTEKNAAGAWCLGGRFYWIEWGITLGRCPTIRGWSKHHLECSKSLCCPRCLSCGRREPFRQWPASSHCCTCTHVSTGASGDTACPRG